MFECPQCFQPFDPPTWGPVECPHCGTMVFVPGPEPAPAPRKRRVSWTTYVGSPTFVLVALNVLMYIVSVVYGHALTPSVSTLQKLGADYGPKVFTGEWWRLFTSMFLHGNFLHIAFNMWALFNLGLLAEVLYGRRNFVWIYLLAGLGGSIASVWWHPVIVGVGASGAIFGVAGALIPAHVFQKNERVRAALKGNLGSLSTFVIYNLVIGAASPHIDNAAHLGGLLTGLLVGWLMPSHTVAEERGDTRRTAIAIAVVSTILLSCGWVAHRSGQPAILLQRGQDALTAGKTDEAIRLLQQSVERDPKLMQSRLLLATTLDKQKRYSESLPHWRTLVETEPESPYLQESLCIAYLRTEDTAKALQPCETATKLNPKDGDAWFNLGLVYRTNARYGDAANAFRKALERHDGFDENYLLGVSLLDDGRAAEALTYLQKAVIMRPDDEKARQALAEARRR